MIEWEIDNDGDFMSGFRLWDDNRVCLFNNIIGRQYYDTKSNI